MRLSRETSSAECPFSSCLVPGGLFFNLADVEIGIGACLAAWAAVSAREGTE